MLQSVEHLLERQLHTGQHSPMTARDTVPSGGAPYKRKKGSTGGND